MLRQYVPCPSDVWYLTLCVSRHDSYNSLPHGDSCTSRTRRTLLLTQKQSDSSSLVGPSPASYGLYTTFRVIDPFLTVDLESRSFRSRGTDVPCGNFPKLPGGFTDLNLGLQTYNSSSYLSVGI